MKFPGNVGYISGNYLFLFCSLVFKCRHTAIPVRIFPTPRATKTINSTIPKDMKLSSEDCWVVVISSARKSILKMIEIRIVVFHKIASFAC